MSLSPFTTEATVGGAVSRDNEYEILQSEDFADRIEDMTFAGDVDIVTSGNEMVTNVRDKDTAGSSND